MFFLLFFEDLIEDLSEDLNTKNALFRGFLFYLKKWFWALFLKLLEKRKTSTKTRVFEVFSL